ncbi:MULTISPECIES: Uma2 family endonuclease [Moraxella]|jgi:uncharacterized protein slr1290|uniref:Putative restriction endonuclease domain-containing protein n=2 Tax=Moraxella lacunata TaxID=477 RepID=A0A1B8PV50_MORLA|nr:MULTISPECIES: Uma2 family endonuclease [Moraxella]MBE9579841.1 Uma2 family endonuclease [Moraxella sp. K1664]MBE9589214.1 Uma2 family endonuclease [Moraxella sp. K1630]MBE9591566.1 Uma2 family endonuclease [Moraxella sp. K127]MBE9597465.1 Uma2 family endonuclease [Moraxella sp. K2450]MDH9219958.1 Uma2 family endonuclease [Moraxella lacunata]
MTTLNTNFPLSVLSNNQAVTAKQKSKKMTVAEFVAYMEKNPNEYVELIDGQIVAMAGGSSNHSLIISNCLDVKFFLRKNMPDCKVRPSDFGIQTSEYQVRYPDFSIACGVEGDALVTARPILIGEVLSKSNTNKEMSMKIDEYKNLHSVEEIVMISQKTKSVTIHRRGKLFGWHEETYTNGIVEYKSIGYFFDIDDLYIDTDIGNNK